MLYYFVNDVLDRSIALSASLIIILGCLIAICLLLYPIYFVLNNILYKRTKASMYFIHYMKHRKEFNKWYRDNKFYAHLPKIHDRENTDNENIN